MGERILVINPGSTSTKIAVFDGEATVLSCNIPHGTEELRQFPTIPSQFDFRLAALRAALAEAAIPLESLDFIMARGGALKPVSGGAWAITETMLSELRQSLWGEHASSLGALLAHELAQSLGIRCCVADPPVVDELDDVARLAGHPAFTRKSRFHALNQKAVARRAAAELCLPYDRARLVVAHLGGGISVGVHRDGRVVDVNDAYDGEGPFSPERSGTLPAGQLAKLCLSGEYDQRWMKLMMVGEGGMYAYLGTTDLREALARKDQGDARAALVLEAMVYQTAKEIGAAATVLEGKLDGIVLTGSIVYSDWIRENLVRRVSFLGRIFMYPGEEEMLALRDAARRVMASSEGLQTYL